MAGHGAALDLGLGTLKAYRDGRGGWGRFPFHYTLLLLTGVRSTAARHEIDYCAERLHRARRLLAGRRDRLSRRRLRIIDRALATRGAVESGGGRGRPPGRGTRPAAPPV